MIRTVARAAAAVAVAVAFMPAPHAAATLPTPEQFLGFRVGADNKLIRWDKIVEYMKLASESSDRVRYRELGKSSNNNPFIVLEISAPDTLKNLDKYKQMERKLYFQGGAPTDAERDAIIAQGKVVLVITCSIHATEIGAAQMSVELVHRLATESSPEVKKILDNVIFLLVPSLNPDGEIMVTDWFNKNVGTPFEPSPIPYLYHPYVGHDNNRDMYMFTQKESQHTAQLLWHDWFPSVWLDEHQQGSNGPRIFTMPATDPINMNVHPLIYRWNGILGQSQAAALEAAGREGIIYNSTYTNFWEGAMAWSGWWHNQVGLLTEVASARVAAPIDQQKAVPGRPAGGRGEGGGRGGQFSMAPLPPPTDINPRTEYPRPWMGGRWTLRDIVDYELDATMALLETAADRRTTILENIYQINLATMKGEKDWPSDIVVPIEGQQDAREAAHMVDRLQLGGVDIYRAADAFEADGQKYAAGTYVIPMTQVFARYAKDMLEKQTYPEVRRAPSEPPEPPYDVTAWSLGMLLGVKTEFIKTPLAASVKLAKIPDAYAKPGMNASGTAPFALEPKGEVSGSGTRFAFDYKGPDTAIAINRLLKDGAQLAFDAPSHVVATGVTRAKVEAVARDFGLDVKAGSESPAPRTQNVAPRAANLAAGARTNAAPGIPNPEPISFHAPRVAMYQPWTGGNMDEGWTRWVLEQYEFNLTSIHNDDIRAGKLRQRFDAIIVADQDPRSIVDGFDAAAIRPEYRGGIGEAGVENLKQFVADGGTLVTMGNACDLAIERLPIPVRDLKKGLTRDQHFAPGAILRVEVDTQHPIGYGVAADTYGFYINSPFFSIVEGFNSQKTSVVARYPNTNVLASGWLKGEELMAGRAAVVSIDMNPGRVVLFGLRPQHRAQTHATFPLLFNALYLAGAK